MLCLYLVLKSKSRVVLPFSLLPMAPKNKILHILILQVWGGQFWGGHKFLYFPKLPSVAAIDGSPFLWESLPTKVSTQWEPLNRPGSGTNALPQALPHLLFPPICSRETKYGSLRLEWGFIGSVDSGRCDRHTPARGGSSRWFMWNGMEPQDWRLLPSWEI